MDGSLEIFLYFPLVFWKQTIKLPAGSSQRIPNQPGEWLCSACRGTQPLAVGRTWTIMRLSAQAPTSCLGLLPACEDTACCSIWWDNCQNKGLALSLSSLVRLSDWFTPRNKKWQRSYQHPKWPCICRSSGLRTSPLVAASTCNENQINKPQHTFIGLSEKAVSPQSSSSQHRSLNPYILFFKNSITNPN